MKKFRYIITTTICLLFMLAFATSCDDMNDIQSKFTEKEEQVYLGKVDSVKSMPGFGRAKISWYIGSDPKIEQTVIYWNLREDSLVIDFNRTSPGLQRDSIIIENLSEGSTLFEFRNKNSRGESSLFSSANVTVWGSSYASGLLSRKLTSFVFDYKTSEYQIQLSSPISTDGVIYSEFVYTDKNGDPKTIRATREDNMVALPDFADGTEFRYRNVFFMSIGIDTVYANYSTYKAPTAVFDKGKILALKGHTDSRYFNRDDKFMYEWNAAGDIIIYTLNQDGSFTETSNYPGIVSRETLREFFFYNLDKFIGIGKDNRVNMYKIENGNLVVVKEGMGTGFNMQRFIPARTFFYSIASGAARTWFGKDDATWGAPNGATVATDFTYTPADLYMFKHLVGADTNGDLWSIPITSLGGFGSKIKIGSGWNKFVTIVCISSKLLGLDSNGDFYEFDFNATDKYWVLE